jgi:cobalt-zinc-cadmium efflux system outer membrane protein
MSLKFIFLAFISINILNISFSKNYNKDDSINEREISIDNLINYALNNNKYLLISEQNKLISEANLLQSNLTPNPSFLIEYGSNWFIDKTDGYNLNLQYSHPFELFGKRNIINQVSKIQLENTINDISYQKYLFILDLKSEYINMLINNEHLFLTEKINDLSNKILELTKNKYKYGDISKYDLNIIKIELSKTQIELISAEKNVINSMERLKFLTGLNNINIKKNDDIIIKDINIIDIYNKALINRYDIKNLEINHRLYDNQIESIKIQSIPNLNLISSYQSQKGDAQTTNTISLGLSSDLPFFNKNQGLVLEYEILREQNILKLNFLKKQIKSQLDININNINNLSKNIDFYRNNIIPLAMENLEIIKKSYEIGDKNLNDYINEQNKLINIQKNYINSLYEYKQEIISLEKNIGTSIKN